MTDKITQPADTADGKAENNATTSADGARDDGGELLRQLGELRRELECMRGELGAARAAGPGEARREPLSRDAPQAVLPEPRIRFSPLPRYAP